MDATHGQGLKERIGIQHPAMTESSVRLNSSICLLFRLRFAIQ